MKRQIQEIGVRKWFGGDWLCIQDELIAVLEGYFGGFGQQFILSGCVVSGNNIAPGIVGLIGDGVFHICRFPGAQGVTWPIYLKPEKIIENRVYNDNQSKAVSETWTAMLTSQDSGGYFRIEQNDSSPRFFDAIQNSSRRLVTDAEKSTWGNQAASAINTLRNNVASDYDTLQKIASILVTKAPLVSPALSGVPTAPTAAAGTNTAQIANTAFVQAAIAALVASSPAALDTLNELATALGNDPNFAATMTNALAGKEPANANIQTHITSRVNPHGVTKSHVGLSNADNTSDADKPISTATQTALNLKAPLASPGLTGTPTAPTAAAGTNTTQIANTAFVQAAIAALVASSPAALDTLNELATALGNDPNFATTITNALAGKQPIDGDLTAIAALAGTSGLLKKTAANTWVLDTSAYLTSVTKAMVEAVLTGTISSHAHTVTKSDVGLSNADNTSDLSKPISTATQTALNLKAPLASPGLTGTPTAPTAAAGTNTTQIANTAFVQAAIAALVASSPAALDTLNELATALGNDPNFATTITNALAGKQPIDGDLTAIAALAGTSGLLRKTAANTWVLDTSAYLTSVTKAMVEAVLTGTISSHAHTVTKSDVGLSNADNTSDLSKPISTATQTALNLKAPLASPGLTGTPTAPTAAAGTNTMQIANTAFVQAAIAALVASSPAALDTLNELATALGNDPNFATTITNSLAGKLNRDFSNISNVVTALGALGVEGTETLSGTNIDWLGKPVRTKTLTSATTLTFSNLIVNKTITMTITGNYALTLPASVKKITGEYDGTKSNLIQFLCVNTATPEVWCVISQEATA